MASFLNSEAVQNTVQAQQPPGKYRNRCHDLRSAKISRYSGTPKRRLAGARSDERAESAPFHLAGGDGVVSGRGPCGWEGHRMKPLSANGFVSVRISYPKDRHRHSRVYIRNAATYSVSGRLADRRIPPPMKVVVRSSSLLFFLVNVLLGLPIRRRL